MPFLAAPKAKRSIARRVVAHPDGTEIVWKTTIELAWSERLEWEHREWFALGIIVAMMSVLGLGTRRQWIRAGLRQRELGVAPTPPPARMERLVLLALPPFNYPQEVDDLRESFHELALTEGKAAARRWYCWQVRQSLLFYLGQRLQGLFRRGVPVPQGVDSPKPIL